MLILSDKINELISNGYNQIHNFISTVDKSLLGNLDYSKVKFGLQMLLKDLVILLYSFL